MELESQSAVSKGCAYILKNVATEVRNEFPFLDVIFIPYEEGECLKTFQRKRFDIEYHPAGHQLLPSLEKLAAELDASSFQKDAISGIALEKEGGFLGFLEKNSALCCLFILLEPQEDDFSLLQRIYAQLFQVIDLIPSKARALRFFHKKHGDLITLDHPLLAEQNPVLKNLKADVFSSILIKIKGQSNAMIKLAKKRCLEALTAQPKHMPEHYVFPQIYELAKLIVREQDNKISYNTSSLKNMTLQTTIELTRYVCESFDTKAASSWQAFCNASQQMAWAGIEPNKILGTAIYSSEEPFIRTDAYMVSDILALEPMLITNFDFYNPFIQDDINERRHRKFCLDVFESSLGLLKKQSTQRVLLNRAKEQNEKFCHGVILGWCAPALFECANLMESENVPNPVQAMKDIFDKYLNTLEWTVLQSAGIEIINKRRQGLLPTEENLALWLSQKPEWKLIHDTLLTKQKATWQGVAF